MNFELFNRQVNRLMDTFGAQNYREEKVKIIWKSVEVFSDAWMIKTVDSFIGCSRYAPLPADFQTEVSKERERLRSIEKQQQTTEIIELFRDTYHPEEKRSTCQSIRDILTGKMKEEDRPKFVQLLQRVAAHSDRKSVKSVAEPEK